MQPDTWEFVQAVLRLESTVAALCANVEWLTWAIRWLIGLQASTAGALAGVAFFSWRNNRHNSKIKKISQDVR